MLNRRSYILLLCGIAGIACYFLLRQEIDYYASGAIAESKTEVEQKLADMAPKMGFSLDSLAVVTVRKQHQYYFSEIEDTMSQDVSPAKLNSAGLHIQSWEIVTGEKNATNGVFGSPDQLFNSTGRLKFNFSNTGKLIRLNEHPEHDNPTFLQGDSLLAIAEYFISDLLGYKLDLYELAENNSSGELEEINEGLGNPENLNERAANELLEITWRKNVEGSNEPEILTINLKPVVREFSNESGFRTEFGFSVASFIARNEIEPVNLNTVSSEQESDNLLFSYTLFIMLFVLAITIFGIGILNIFKGKVEWKRTLIIFITIALGIYGWRALFFMYTYNPFLNNTGLFASTVNNILFGLVVGLYAAFAYISWEALARTQKQSQVDVIDALWRGKFFISETGAGLVHGVAIGGISIGIISSLLFIMGEYLLQADSQFGFGEASISPKLFTINLSAWTTTWLVCMAQFGFVYSILNHWIKKHWIAALLSILISGISISVLGRLLGTTGTIYQDLIIYLGLAVIFIYALKEFGLLTICTGWWFFTVFFMIQPYLGSPSFELAYVSWVQILLMAGPLIYGFIAHRYGVPVSEVGDYIPEYEERMAQHLRVEKEIEIARESQYKLMPLQAPKVEGVDIHGFFLPSFEVGGDYFDYVLSTNGDGEITALNMVVMDVSGKAMRAAMPAVFTSGLLLSRMKEDFPDHILSRITEPLFTRTDKRTFITCILARYDLKTMTMSIANAGHCRPILKRKGIAEYIKTPAPSYPLGIKEKVAYKAETITMKKGDFFLLFSDGLPEAVNPSGERFGFDEVPRIIESIDTDAMSAFEIAQEIKRAVQKFSNYQLADDTTIICLKV